MKKYLILGASAAGMSAAQTLRRLDPNSEITILTQEQSWPYNKCFLADYAVGTKQEQVLTIFTPERAENLKINLMHNKRVNEIDPHKRRVFVGNEIYDFDALLIATGVGSFIPEIKGIFNTEHIYTFHTKSDIDKILHAIENRSCHVTVIGAGLSGLECADALAHHAVAVTLVEQAPQILPGMVDVCIHERIKHAIDDAGIDLRCNTTVQEIIAKDKKVVGIILDDDTYLSTDMVIFATGTRPNTSFLEQTSILCVQNFIRIDQFMQTNMDTIYAAGDCVMVPHQLTGVYIPSTTWPDAMHQGRIAAYAMAGDPKPYPGILPIVSSAFFGLKFCATLHNPGISAIAHHENNTLTRLYIHENRLQGFEQVGSSLDVTQLRRKVLTQEPFFD